MAREYSVLIVETDSKTQSDLNEVLKSNFSIEQIVTVDNEESAQNELNNQNSFQCIFVNSGITANNGYEFISKIKENEKHKDTAIIMLSEDNSREALLQAAASGVNELVATPISPKLLSLKLKRVFKTKTFRTSKRISVMGALDATLQFESGDYTAGKLFDISSGGCSVRTPLSSMNGRVYDTVQIMLEHDTKSLEIPAELVRIEKDPESEASNEKQLLLAFQISHLSDSEMDKLNQFIELLSN